MDRQTRNLLAVALVLGISVTGGAAILLGGAGAPGPADVSDAQSLVGVIVGVESEGIDKVREFTLRSDDGALVAFTIGNLDNGGTFPAGHLVEHQATAQKVRVWYQMEEETRVAVRLEDAP